MVFRFLHTSTFELIPQLPRLGRELGDNISMPKSCEAYDCTAHNLKTGEKLSFFTFPSREKSPSRRAKWISALKRQRPDGSYWSPSKHLVICSKHFITGL